MSERTRLIGLAIAYVAALVAAALIFPWFRIDMQGLGGIEIGMRTASACANGRCVEFVLPTTGSSSFVWCARIAFWGGFAYALVVIYQVYARLAQDYASPDLTRKVIPVGIGLALLGLAAGFLLAPDLGGGMTAGGQYVESSRTFAPFLYVAAQVLGIVVVMLASKAAVEAPVAAAAPGPYARTPVAPAKDPTPPPARPERRSDPISAQHPLRGKVNYVVASAEVTRAGMDARREDGSSLLVMWRDVVGFVVRRAPDDLDGVTFADVVSVKGATLRVVPWSRLSGDATGQGDERIRALATLAQANCEQLAIDGATKKFLAGEPAGQLKDAALLATHDERLA